ncbi:D-inositol-3-phosphate glycosyltransferase [Microbulbifer aestuariivivens]|uniref:D-inositol-3-phosphate glycosyltransferase n=1 Tax=Microbulbifer aestuariivivens TaxID=1908308 RepID=A0ABP9WLY3_9GAMM
MARIAVDARPLASPTTGIGRYTKALLERLFNSQHDWFLYTHKKLLVDFSRFSNVTIRSADVDLSGSSSLISQFFFPVWSRKDKIDLFWSPRHHLPLLMPDHIAQVVTIHDLVWLNYPNTMSVGGRYLEKLCMPGSLKKARKIISVSKSTALDISNFFPEFDEKIVTIYEAPFIDLIEGCPTLGDYFLFVGTIEPRKNLITLLEAYKLYSSDVEYPLPLKICGGKGWGMPELNKKIDELGLSGRVEILGYIDDENMAELYKDARALLMPSLYEGFGLPIVEALSQGTPVLTSNRGATAEVAGDAGVLVTPEDAREICGGLELLTLDLKNVKILQQLALKRSQSFSWDVAANSSLQLFETLLENCAVSY